jgi:hypothetical protein
VVQGGARGCTVVHGDLRWCTMVHVGVGSMMTHFNAWWCKVVHGGACRCMLVHGLLGGCPCVTEERYQMI